MNAKQWKQHQQGPEESRYIVADDGLFIARMDTEANDEEWRLAATAPDLLAALKAIIEEGHTDYTRKKMTALFGSLAVNAARDAIAKAEGRATR